MKTALLIVDVQNDYFPGGKNELAGSVEASGRIKVVIEEFRRRNLDIIYIQHISQSPTAGFFLPNTEGVKIHSNVYPNKKDKIFIKHFPNSFRDTGLDEYCVGKGIDSLVIAGMMSHMCIDATVRAGYDLGYKIIVLSDCCATKDLKLGERVVRAEDVHLAHMAAIKGTFADVTTVDEYIKE
ncbi:MAG TPA: cysteine hydrolase [Spirochaetaceae bacterium]|nr:cysteine hydrolase [Spirochaetaceae bacterium]